MPKFDEEQISFIGGESIAWPKDEQITHGDHWYQMHRAVKALREVVAGSCNRIGAIEDNRDLAEAGRGRQLAEVGLDIIKRVDETPALNTARVRAVERIQKLDAEMTAHAKPPEDAAGLALAGEIRATLRAMAPAERMRFIRQNLAEPGVAGAVSNGPAFLTGMSETEAGEVRGMIAETLYAPQAAEKAMIQRGLRELDVAVDRAHRLVAGRSRVARNIHGEWAPSTAAPGIAPIRMAS